ncbi:DUF4767 domain-containing protein [Companilactobacillus crustorum]|uniref:DUF4767 domain-containing protein n=3 Tax=Companilactobacillus TaxID=2767879 RepID=A0A837RJS6_9LACO|nr:DUF4767 domain-containing protein [Companilactobacillus crustorum]APU70982.1 hypothetical protein BI355_0659 [Companilactobacillus crustorum]KRK44338.1 hypothetical protein FD26_GL000696 [Companilactobacillus crustorum JCM 15951]KRO21643.1 hypothetical protein IV63_GL000731 [Companilactobacillus crustorum]GEO75598.1 DUF4767 domain-containing protein [Companilactobacillus crustorum]
MIIKTSHAISVLLLGTLLLTGCNSNFNNSTSKKTATTSISHKKTSSIKNSKVLWNSDKDVKLKEFINQWAPTMHQSYVKYDGKHSLNISNGTTYPDDLKHVKIGNNNASIGWNKTGKGNYQYNVVAIYNYNENESSLSDHITYFFTFHNGKPIVLVDQTTNGTPNLFPTENNVLKNGFENIAKGKAADVSVAASSSTSNASDNSNNNKNSSTQSVSDPKIVGIMLYEYDRDFDTSDIPHMLLITPDSAGDGRYYIGTGTTNSTLPFTIEGNTAHYWTRLYNGNDIRPDGTEGPSPETEHIINLNTLTARYYSTSNQKQTVDQIAEQMTVG